MLGGDFMLPLNLENILQFLKDEGYEAHIQAETGQIYCILKILRQDFPLFIRIFEESKLLQLIVFIPSAIKEGAFNDAGRLLHLINKQIDVPGFGMDETAKIPFYRIMLPSFESQIDSVMLKSYLHSMKIICENFAPTIITVANGAATFEGVQKR